jgi:hypothetical protein
LFELIKKKGDIYDEKKKKEERITSVGVREI